MTGRTNLGPDRWEVRAQARRREWVDRAEVRAQARRQEWVDRAEVRAQVRRREWVDRGTEVGGEAADICRL